MKTLAVALFALATLTTGCASMGTKRSGGAQITKTSSESVNPIATDHDPSFDGRADLGQR